MWFKLFLLLLYFVLLFVFSRLLEVVAWCNGTSTFFSNSRSLLNPVTLSVKKLKQLLDNRGVSYSWAVEKTDLIQLVEASGSVGEKEVELIDSPIPQTTQFSCGSHFYEEVEDTKDSVWLVQVIAEHSNDVALDDTTWKEVIVQVSKFGVRTGVFRCSLDPRLCTRKMWTSSRVILALPQGSAAKDDVILHTYLQSTKTNTIINWTRALLTSRVKTIRSVTELSQNWLSYKGSSEKSKIKLILFSTLKEPPLFLSSLAIKFTGRVDFAMVNMNERNFNMYQQKLFSTLKIPTYSIITPERQFEYGIHLGENFVYSDMEFFLKSLYPEMNDIFSWSLLLVNAIVGFELFLIKGKLWKCLLRCIICIVKYNCLLFLTWLLMITLYKFSFMTTITEFLLKTVRVVNGTTLATILRYDWKIVWSYYFLILVYIAFGSVIGLVLRRIGKITVVDDVPFFSDWSTFPWYNFISSCFFRPMVTLTRPMTYQELDLEEGMELLIERLAVPNLWLQPMISPDYIKDLPVWKYRGWCDADDEEIGKSDITSSSEDELTNSSDLPSLNKSDDVSKCSNINVHSLICRNFSGCFYSQENSLPSQKCQDSTNCDNLPTTVSFPCSGYSKDSKKPELQHTILPPCDVTKEETKICDAQRAPAGMLEFRECSICIEKYCYGETLCGLPCGHNYHVNCIMAWLYRDNHCCPICRWPSYKFKTRPVHLHTL